MRILSMLRNLIGRDPNKDFATPRPDPEHAAATARNSLAADNLRATLTELLNESDRLNFRPVYIAGPRPDR